MAAPDHPLASWNDGAVKSAVIEFVARVTNERDPNWTPPTQRVAVFDNDGTLSCEQPLPAQAFFVGDRIEQLAMSDPSMKDRQPFKAFIEHDFKTLLALGKEGLQDLFFATHCGLTEETFDEVAQSWFASARHPELNRPFTQCAYRPQVELLTYLRENGFKCYIVSAGGVDFVRAFAEETYGVPREQVIGSSAKLRFEAKDGRAVLMKAAELDSFDNREAKPQNIGLHVGRRPILAFGNSDGDLAMLRYTKSGEGPRLALLLHHDDAEREFAYDREFKVSPLAEALDKAAQYGITLVSMKRDWAAIF